MTFLLRSTVSLLCLSLLAVGPAIAAGSDDEGDDEASTSAPRVKRQRGASVDDDNDQEEKSSTSSNKEALISSFVRKTDALRKEINRLEIALEETNQQALEKIERKQSRLVDIERDDNLTVLLLREESEESIESIDAALTTLLGHHDGEALIDHDTLSRPPFINVLLRERDFERRKKVATVTRDFYTLAGSIDQNDQLRIFGYFMDRRTDDFDTIVRILKANIEQAMEIDVVVTNKRVAHFIQSFPSYYSPRVNWTQNNPTYKTRLQMASRACDYCFMLGLNLEQRDSLIRHIFSWEPKVDDEAPEAEIPLKDFMVKLFEDRFVVLGFSFEKMQKIQKPFMGEFYRNSARYSDKKQRDAFIKSLPNDYVSQGDWDPTYDERLLIVIKAQDMCRLLYLSESEKTQVVSAIFEWQRPLDMDPYEDIPVASLLEGLFPDKYAVYLERKRKEEEDRPSREAKAKRIAEQYRGLIES